MRSGPAAVPRTVAPLEAPSGAERPSTAAQLCWHASMVCRALDRGVAELQAALALATQHADAVVALAIQMADQPDVQPATVDARAVSS